MNHICGFVQTKNPVVTNLNRLAKLSALVALLAGAMLLGAVLCSSPTYAWPTLTKIAIWSSVAIGISLTLAIIAYCCHQKAAAASRRRDQLLTKALAAEGLVDYA